MKAYLTMGILSGFIDIPELVPEIYIQWDGRYFKRIYSFDGADYIKPESGAEFSKLVFMKGSKLAQDLYEYYYAGVY